MFGLGKSEADLVKSVPGLACGDPQTDLWGHADRSCMTVAQALPGVGATIVFNLRSDKLVSAILVIDRTDLRAMLDELTRRHGAPDAAVPSLIDPEKVVWLTADRALILDKTLPGMPDVSSLLVSADQAILQQARSLLTRSHGPGHPGELTAK